MLSDSEYLYLVLGMGLVTYLPRWLPLFVLSQRKLPRWLIEWLDLIPAAILSALVFQDLFVRGGGGIDLFNPKALIALPTLIFALKTKSLGGTVVVGMLLYWMAGKVS